VKRLRKLEQVAATSTVINPNLAASICYIHAPAHAPVALICTHCAQVMVCSSVGCQYWLTDSASQLLVALASNEASSILHFVILRHKNQMMIQTPRHHHSSLLPFFTVASKMEKGQQPINHLSKSLAESYCKSPSLQV
jgi:hypothetical protein